MQLGKNRVYFLLQFEVYCEGKCRNSMKKSRGKNWSREHGRTPFSRLLLMACSDYILKYLRTTYLVMRATIHNRQTTPISTINQENTQNFSQNFLQSFNKLFLSWSFLAALSNNSDTEEKENESQEGNIKAMKHSATPWLARPINLSLYLWVAWVTKLCHTLVCPHAHRSVYRHQLHNSLFEISKSASFGT